MVEDRKEGGRAPDADMMARAAQVKRDMAIAAAARQEDAARERLLAAARQRMRTVFIGALARVEDHFGALWGHPPTASGFPAQLSDQAILAAVSWEGTWQSCREAILDLGHAQSRPLERELAQYVVRLARPLGEVRDG